MGIVQRRLTIPSDPEHIQKLEPFIEDVTRPYGLDKGNYGKILISVTEAVNNAIRHGNRVQVHRKVNIRCHQNGKTIKFWVSDEGEGFDPDRVLCPTSPECIGKAGGRGVYLMRQLADEVKFKDNGSTVKLSFYVR